MKSQGYKLLILLIMVAVSACSSDDDATDDSIRITDVVSVDTPESVRLGNEVTIEVKFRVYNGCGQFHRFLETGRDQDRVIKVEAQYVGEICTTDVPIRTVPYSFIPTTTGIYKLSFLSLDNEYIVVRILVN